MENKEIVISEQTLEKFKKRIKERNFQFAAEDAYIYYATWKRKYHGIDGFLKKFNVRVRENAKRQIREADKRGETLYFDNKLIAETAHRMASKVRPYKSRRRRLNKASGKPKKKWIPYDEQLQDPKWSEFREKVFRARGRRCEHCGSLEHLQVHHPEYIDGHKAWEYTTNQVIVLCRNCHKKEHHIVEEVA